MVLRRRRAPPALLDMSEQIEITNLGTRRLFNPFLKKILSGCLKRFKNKKNISLVLTGDKKIKELNRRYRRKNKITDVLSFGGFDEEDFLGEIMIDLTQARRQAKDFGLPLKKELTRLAAHGFLHLLGYEHEKGGLQAKKMLKIQEKLCSILKE